MAVSNRLLLALLLLPYGLVAAATRRYFIAVDEVEWDYAPLNRNGITGLPFSRNGTEASWTLPSKMRIGKLYKKALYREYTDSTFSVLKTRSAEWKHLGILGPLIRAEVGDTIVVLFKNHARYPYSMHPHGVFYKKPSEGVPSYDGSASNGGGIVAPGNNWTYEWFVPERAGPASADPSSMLWMYHSHVDESKDVNAGLVGPILITRVGSAAPMSLRPRDVLREFVVLFAIFDENLSHYLEENIVAHLGAVRADGTVGATGMSLEKLREDPEFVMSNQKHAVSGLLYANLQGLEMAVNETVRWYVLAVGGEMDIHGAHWHGETLLFQGHRVDVIELIPASMKTLDMRPDNEGRWLFHCHTTSHITAGMTATFNVALSPREMDHLPEEIPVSVSKAALSSTWSSVGGIQLLFVLSFLLL